MLSPAPPLGADGPAPYAPRAGVHDELVDAEGGVRPHWAPFLGHLGQLGPDELARRWARAQELIHENGVSYNVHGDPQGMDRPWPLSPLPVVLAESEWSVLSAGLIQRARLLERLLDDLYGPQRLLADGLIPPAVVFGHPGFLRACQGHPVGRWLPFYAVDVGRGPDGGFRVISDRTQVPTGAGYALENRIIVSRTFPEAFRGCEVQRLAPFFQSLRDTLTGMAPRNRDNPRIAVLTAGPIDPTYFEQAFLAQYLGYPLVHGGDLTVRGARVYLKTLGGLQPVDVILRRVNDDLCDPLELRPDGLGGIPGLVQAVRERQVAVANPLGSGLAAAPALLPLLAPLCRHLLGEELRLPSVETLWCGDPDGRRRARAALADGTPLVVKPAFEVSGTQPIFTATLDAGTRAALAARIEAEPASWVAEEQLALGTTPVARALIDAAPGPLAVALPRGGLEPRHWVLRCYLVATPAGHMVMPGGLTRFAPTPGALEVSIQRGGRSKDTWVASSREPWEGSRTLPRAGSAEASSPAPHAAVRPTSVSLLPGPGARITLSRGGADLPSRVADNFFWLGRYAERAEGLARLGRVLAIRIGEQPADAALPEETAPLVQALAQLANLRDRSAPELRTWESVLAASLRDPRPPGGLAATLRALQRVARECRDRLSGDSSRLLMRVAVSGPGGLRPVAPVEHGARPPEPPVRPSALLPALDGLVLTLSALSGIVADSMTRGLAWRFLDMGRRLERASALVALLGAALTAAVEREAPLLESVLEAADSGMTYRRRYLSQLAAAPVLDLLLTDETNPRAVIFQVNALCEHLAGLPGEPNAAVRTPEQRLALELRAELQLADVESLGATAPDGSRAALAARLERWGKALPALSDALSASYLSHATQSRQLGETLVRRAEESA